MRSNWEITFSIAVLAMSLLLARNSGRRILAKSTQFFSGLDVNRCCGTIGRWR
jgi:hypothetical protein